MVQFSQSFCAAIVVATCAMSHWSKVAWAFPDRDTACHRLRENDSSLTLLLCVRP